MRDGWHGGLDGQCGHDGVSPTHGGPKGAAPRPRGTKRSERWRPFGNSSNFGPGFKSRAMRMQNVPFSTTAPEMEVALQQIIPELCGRPFHIHQIFFYRSCGKLPEHGPLTCFAYVVYGGHPPRPEAMPAVMSMSPDGKAELRPGAEFRGSQCDLILLEECSQRAPAPLAAVPSLYGKVWTIGGGRKPRPLTLGTLLEVLCVAAKETVRYLDLAHITGTGSWAQVAQTEFLAEALDADQAAALKSAFDEQRVTVRGCTYLISCEFTSARPNGGGERLPFYKPVFVFAEQRGMPASRWDHQVRQARTENRHIVNAVKRRVVPGAEMWADSSACIHPISPADTPELGGSYNPVGQCEDPDESLFSTWPPEVGSAPPPPCYIPPQVCDGPQRVLSEAELQWAAELARHWSEQHWSEQRQYQEQFPPPLLTQLPGVAPADAEWEVEEPGWDLKEQEAPVEVQHIMELMEQVQGPAQQQALQRPGQRAAQPPPTIFDAQFMDMLHRVDSATG
eukprot:TRINITY_DN61614_c0_g1_i1.p1 TRINITY_DN61614_c0_g1~~TRINITY_DN61614_c0_g1_i1.p1  ORF type:complete len:536 (+),score=158.34 TRINITY_DN61614_c0_g1_i1:89-1609(+)